MSARASVTVTPRPLWMLRLGPRLMRAVMALTAITGIVACARYAIAPPRPAPAPAPVQVGPDEGAEAFAVLFARRYLTWSAAVPLAHQRSLLPLVGGSVDPDAGLSVPAQGAQQVQWAQVVQQRPDQPGEVVYTVAAQTDADGLVYLTVPVARLGGRLTIAGYPAFVGPPASAPFDDLASGLRDVDDGALAQVVSRALGNYLADSPSELAADLAPGARVSLPELGLELAQVSELKWLADRRSVLAEVQATDRRGATYTLAYELDVERVAARWQVSAIQMDPDQ